MKTGCEDKRGSRVGSRELPVLGNGEASMITVRNSKAGKIRAIVLIALNAAMIAHIVQWLATGRTISPVEPSETMQTLQQGAVNAGFIFFSVAILATLVFGRFVCGWACHLVALQDLCGWMLKKLGLKPRPFRSRLLIWVPLLVALYMFVWPTVNRYLVKPPNEPVIPEFTNHLIVSDYWATFPPIAVAIPFLFVCGFMTVYFLGQKGFCTYACPYGGFFGIAEKLAPGRIRVTDACNQCGHCTAVCTSNVLVHAEVRDHGAVVDPGCMKCLDCVSVCPNDALYFGFGKPSIATGKPAARNYSLSWPEEILAAIVFALSLFAVWDVYQLVPMLMALGIATVSTFVFIKSLKLFRSPDSTFYRYQLRSGRRLKPAGWIFIGFSIVWLALNAHSGFIRYNEREGARAFESIRIPDELALAHPNPKPWLGATDRKNIAEGKRHFDLAMKYGLFTNNFALSKLAWIDYLNGDTDRALEMLSRSAAVQSGSGRAISLYYSGAIRNRTGKFDLALTDLNTALTERPDLVVVREEQGEALWNLGRREEADAAWKEALRESPQLVLANLFLAGSAASRGESVTAQSYEDQAERITPRDPFFNWMLGLRLQNVGMNALADKRFKRAIEINPGFRMNRTYEAGK